LAGDEESKKIISRQNAKNRIRKECVAALRDIKNMSLLYSENLNL